MMSYKQKFVLTIQIIMKNSIPAILVTLLFLSGGSAFYGGVQMITHPDGSSLELPIQYLERTPFVDYLMPGILLLGLIGIYELSLAAIITTGTKRYAWPLLVQGIILCGWIAAQLMYHIPFSILHFVFMFLGLLFVFVGINNLRTIPRP